MYRITLMYERVLNGEFHRTSIKLTKAEYEGLKKLIGDVPPSTWLTQQAASYKEDNFTQHVRDLIITGGNND